MNIYGCFIKFKSIFFRFLSFFFKSFFDSFIEIRGYPRGSESPLGTGNRDSRWGWGRGRGAKS